MISQHATGGRMINQPTNKGTSKRHKKDEKSTNFAVHISQYIFGLKIINYTTTHSNYSKLQWDIYFNSKFWQRNVYHRFISFFWFGSNPQKRSLCRALIVLLHFGTHPSKMGKELVYYHLYHEEASFFWASVFNCLIGLLSFF